jgi:prevent-host-death family protein
VAITTLSSREFNQDTSRAKKAAEKGPVIITDRGKPAHVLLSIEEYRKLASKQKTLGQMLAMERPDRIDSHFEFPKLGNELPRPAEFK